MLKIALLALVFVSAQAMTWLDFKATFDKNYASILEEESRYKIFQENMAFIEAHNAQNDQSFTVAMNQFGDLTAEEFASKIALKPSLGQTTYDYPKDTSSVSALPPSQDWRTSGCVGTVMNQGQCGASWALVSVRMIQIYNCLKHQHALQQLSVQDVLDCTPGSQGCNGGLISSALQYCIDQGIDSEASYPYTGVSGTCKHKNATVAARCTKWHQITPPGNETALTEVLAYTGPVACALDASRSSFQFYSSGVYSDPTCSSKNLDHVMLNVGYGSTGGADYYIMMNSWGASWGMQGYMELARNKHNMCGVATNAVYVTVQ